MQPGALAASFNLASLDRAFLDDPYPTYRALRAHDPVHRMPDGSYFLTRYDDLVEVYRDTGTWSSDKKIQFKPNSATPCFTSTTPQASSSTIRRSTPGSASCCRHRSRRGRFAPCSRALRRWWIGCSMPPPSAGKST
jgi:hypothetical protein